MLLGTVAGILLYDALLTPGARAQTQAQRTLQSMQMAREALLGYAVTYRETHSDEGYGYLPCPDLLGNGEAAATCGTTGVFALGLFPYKTLGLNDLRDGNDECLWYAVSGRFKNNPKSELLNWDTQGELDINNPDDAYRLGAANDLRGGIVAIVFSPGQALNDQATNRTANNFPCHANPQQAEKYLESTQPPFHQSTSNSSSNDQLLWLTNSDIFSRLRLRKDFSAYINTGINSLQSALGFNQTQLAPTLGSRIPSTIGDHLSGRDARFHLQWHDQFAYLGCPDSNRYCYRLAAQQCGGVLIFSGENTNGRPRSTTARSYADYFESALGLVSGTSNNLSQPATDYGATSLATRSRDLVRCVSPKLQTLGSTLLNQKPVTTSNVATLANNALDTATDPWLKLGRADTASALSAGCAWFPEPLVFGTGNTATQLRLYMSFTIVAANQGFTLTIADADTNSSTRMCGKGGAFLGYAGSDIGFAPINAPKIGLEFDTQCNGATFGETPCATPWQQMSFLHWGKDDGLNDDNRHGLGNNMPIGSSAERNGLSLIGALRHVRLEMGRHYDDTIGISRHVLNAWLSDDILRCPELSDLSADMATLRTRNPACPAPLIFSRLDISRTEGNGVPFKQAWLGFTAGQEGGAQTVLIHKLIAEVSLQ
jgi:hypothetical protein